MKEAVSVLSAGGRATVSPVIFSITSSAANGPAHEILRRGALAGFPDPIPAAVLVECVFPGAVCMVVLEKMKLDEKNHT